MPKTKSAMSRRKSEIDTRLSTRTLKQLDSLPEHPQRYDNIKILRKGVAVKVNV
jgi:hypothetical protein